MRQHARVPIEFEAIADQLHYFHEVVHGFEYAAACVECGGTVHQNGDWPDRLRLWPRSRKTGKPLAWCRHCGWKWTPKETFKPDPALIAKLEAERQKAIAEHEAAVKRARATVQREKKWQTYIGDLSDHPGAVAQWMDALGINDVVTAWKWFEYWQLGCDPSHTFWNMNGNEQFKSFKSPTLTVPLCDLNGKAINIKHRLLKIGEDGQKYRQEYRGTGEGIFIANRKLMNKADWVILAEGEKKAMVAYITADRTDLQVFGLPITPSLELLGAINGKHILYIPDPDVFEDGKKYGINRVISVFAQRDLRIVKLPDKLDDLIIREKKSAEWLLGMWKLPRWTMEKKYNECN